MVAQACNPMWEVEAGRSGIQGHFWLHSEVEAILGYMRPCLKKNIFRKGKNWLVSVVLWLLTAYSYFPNTATWDSHYHLSGLYRLVELLELESFAHSDWSSSAGLLTRECLLTGGSSYPGSWVVKAMVTGNRNWRLLVPWGLDPETGHFAISYWQTRHRALMKENLWLFLT